MYCVIQEIQNKKSNRVGCHKSIIATETKVTDAHGSKTIYGFTYSDERFERNINKTYKISIHESYREKGKVKKKQCVIATMGYYDLVEYWIGDFLIQSTLDSKLEVLGITEEELWDIVYTKLQPLIDKVEAEYRLTEEHKEQEEQRSIIKAHLEAKYKFDNIYGQGEYNFCYDVFGNLRNKEYLEKLKQQRAEEKARTIQ